MKFSSILKRLLQFILLRLKENMALAIIVFAVVVLLPKAPKIAVFDKGLAITSFAQELNAKKVSAERQRILVAHFIKALPKALSNYAKKHSVVILNQKEVLAGASNITSKVLKLVALEMKKDKSHG